MHLAGGCSISGDIMLPEVGVLDEQTSEWVGGSGCDGICEKVQSEAEE